MNAIAEQLAREYPATNKDIGAANLIGLRQMISGDIRARLLVLMCAHVENRRSLDERKSGNQSGPRPDHAPRVARGFLFQRFEPSETTSVLE